LENRVTRPDKQVVDAAETVRRRFPTHTNDPVLDRAGGGASAGCVSRPQKRVNLDKMTKQQLIEQVAAKTELGKAEVEAAVDSILELIMEKLQANERVDLRGFGSFVVKDRKERQGRNPRTGETITIAAKRDASFRAGKELMEKLAQGETAPRAGDAV
jgi:nucleoid DNA-binding protein